ncbi:hypothetical protein ACEQ8H_006655 [Pleosporales sp. CAS-2024a]
MFSKRRRAASNPQQRTPTSASASIAATQAFLRDRESSPNLSSAAAAAALRTHVTTPPPVGDTVTKRMLRRNSASSNGSATLRPDGLQRKPSSGSMTERTFRSPSPGRNHSPQDPNAPPVPCLPQHLPPPTVAHRRASSLEPLSRGGSSSSRGGGRGVSLDRGAGLNPGARAQRATSSLAQVAEDDPDSAQRASVNFSRPMSPASAAKSGWFGGPVVNQDAVQRIASTTTARPKTSSGMASAPQGVQNAATRPVSTHQISRGVEGSRLSSGSMRAKPSGTAVESTSFLQPAQRHPARPVDPKSPDAIFDPSTRTFVHKKDAMALHRELEEEPAKSPQHYIAQHVQEHHPPRFAQQQPPRTPSPVRRSAQHDESPAVQKRKDVVLPRLDTAPRTRGPNDPPTGILAEVPHSTAEDSADADHQPPEQANTGRKLENTIIQPTHIETVDSPQIPPNQGSSYPRLATPSVSDIANTLAGPGRGSVRTEHGRGQSLSPPRNAHFAPVAVELAGIKHHPPPRSSSPAKSALKSSPSVSRRGTSPASQNGRLLGIGTPSEVSDTASEVGSTKKRRNVRVSFEEGPATVETSAHMNGDAPTPPKGLGASQWSPKTEKDNEFEDLMKPRPALPLFGSIRDKERRAGQEEVPEKVTETVSSTPMSASVGSVGESLQPSTDQAIAGIINHDITKKQAAGNYPLPPEVTTVEGSGSVSDSSDEADREMHAEKHGSIDDSSQILSVPEPKSLTASHEDKPSKPSSIKESIVNVPEIALMPATPSPYEKSEPTFLPLTIPGGWSEDGPEADKRSKVTPAATVQPIQPVSIDRPIQPTQSPTNLHDLVTRDDEESSDDNSSVYSDAYEDLDDSGFASIDALVESPVASKSSGLMFSRHVDKSETEPTGSALRNETVLNDTPQPVTVSNTDWDATKQHWSDVNAARKQPQAEQTSEAQAATNDVVARVMAAPIKQDTPRAQRSVVTESAGVPQPSPKPLKSALKKPAVVQPAPLTQTQPQMRKTMRDHAPREDGASQPHMRTSMRDSPGRDARSAEPQMRKSMRTGPPPAPRAQTPTRTTMRGANPVGLAGSRYSMPPMDQKPPRAALQKKHIPASAVAAKPRPQSMATTPVKQSAPVPTYDSDSDASASSFQRARSRRAGNQNNRHTMRGSMRQNDAPTMRSATPAPRQPIRSISPPGSPSPALRKSMWPSSPTPERPKSSRFSIRSLSPMGRFRTSKPIEAAPPSPTQPRKPANLSKQAKQKAPIAERVKPAFKSRFADSSDEDDDGGRPSRFQSRFADSDDDEPYSYTLPQGLTPVRGIPRKAGEEDGDSTDLEEELEDEPAPSATITLPAKGSSNSHTNGATNGQGAILASGSLRDSKHATLPLFEGGGKSKSKRGFFGLGKKNATSSPVSAPQSARSSADVPMPTKAASFDIPAPPQPRNRDHAPLTPIDEDKGFGESAQSSPEVARSSKLQRRSTPEWPLPRNNIPVPPIPDDARPMSSDGIAPRRPPFVLRTASQLSNATAPDTAGRSVSYGRAGKKKRFQGLRRVFGLND